MHENDTLIALVSGGIGTVVFLGVLIVNIFYSWSLFSAMKKVPEEKRVVPAWLSWFLLIPVVGIVFNWILEPFAIPNSFAAACDKNDPVVKGKISALFGLGLAHVIMMTLCIIPFLFFILGIPILIVWIIYWVKIVNFKNEHLLTLENKQSSSADT